MGERSVRRAAEVRDQGVVELQETVERGQVSVRAAADTLTSGPRCKNGADAGRSRLLGQSTATREQFDKVRDMLAQGTVGIAQVAKEMGLTRQTVYRIKDDPAGSEAALVAWAI